MPTEENNNLYDSLSDYSEPEPDSDSDSDISEIRNLNKTGITKIQMDTIKKIINMFPKTLEKHENDIINNVIGNAEKEDKLILTKVVIDEDVYYRFNNSSILLNATCDTCGVYYKIKGTYHYFPFKNTEIRANNLSESCEKYYKN